MPLRGSRPPMIGRSNSEEGEGGKYAKSKNSRSKSEKGALGYNYKFLPSGIKYLHEKPGASKTRIAQPNLSSLTADHLAAGSLFKAINDQKPKFNQVIFNPLHGLQS